MKNIPRWAVVSSTAAPVLLGGGWTIAAALQPKNYSQIRDTISALAAIGANDRWVMSSALVGLGVCHVVTSAGLEPVGKAGRIVLGAGGVATILVAVFPMPHEGNSVAHTVVAGIAFTALGVWPIIGAKADGVSKLIRRPTAGVASAIMVGLSSWFAFQAANPSRGLVERAAAGTQALWPLAVVLALRHALKAPSSTKEATTAA